MNFYSIKKYAIQDGNFEIKFYKNDILEFEKIEIPNLNDGGMNILINAWLRGDLDK